MQAVPSCAIPDGQTKDSAPKRLTKWLAAALVGAVLAAVAPWIVTTYGTRLTNWIFPDRPVVDVAVQDQPSPVSPGRPTAVPLPPPVGTAGLEVDPWPTRWVFPTEVPPSKIDELNAVSHSEADTGEWVYDNGGFDLGVTRIRIVLQGRDQPVIITGARARIRERIQKLKGPGVGR